MTTRNRSGHMLSVGAPATFVDRVLPDGVIVRWESRHHRKHQKPAIGSTWWAPRCRGWWIAILFAIGSLLFAIGSVPAYASAVGAIGDTVTYFVGSLFFTTASFLSYREAVDAAPGALNPAQRRRRWRRVSCGQRDNDTGLFREAASGSQGLGIGPVMG